VANSKYLFPVALMLILIAVVALAYILVTPASLPSPGPGSSVTTSIYNGTSNSTNELSNITKFYPNAGPNIFSCSSDSDCELVHTQACFNNLRSQQTCIAKSFNSTYLSYYDAFLRSNSDMACPMFLVSAIASCACVNGNCSMLYNAQ
jgi:hypothetical protein